MKRKATKIIKSWTQKIVEPKPIKQDGQKFTLKPQKGMRLIDEDG